MPPLSGTAVVTGAASGIGRATALRLRDDGLNVIAVDRDVVGLASLDGMEQLQADVTASSSRDEVVAAAAGANFLVNAAGVIRLKPILEFTVQDIRDIYAVNVDALWDLTSRIGRELPSDGAIVNVSSMSAKLATTTETAVYASSKAAVLSITRSFAHKFAENGVRVNAICPGIIQTAMHEEVLTRLSEIRGIPAREASGAWKANVPLKRSAAPEECAGLIRFLLSDEAGYMTGQAIDQSGGMVMW